MHKAILAGGLALAATALLAGCADQAPSGVSQQAAADPAVATAPSDAGITCTYRVASFGGSVVMRGAGLTGYTNSTIRAGVDCQSFRIQMESGSTGKTVTFADPPSTAPACTALVNGVSWTLWDDGYPMVTQAACTSITGR